MKFFLASILLLPCWLSLQSQSQKTDSLKAVLASAPADTARVKILNRLCDEFFNQYEFDSLQKYSRLALSLSQQIDYESGLAKAEQNLANYFWSVNRTDEARRHLQLSVAAFQKIKDTAGMARSTFLIGQTYLIDDNFGEAIKPLYASIRLYELSKNEKPVSEVFSLVGLAQLCLLDTTAAILSLEKNQEIFKRLGGSQVGYGNASMLLGDIYFNRNDLVSARKYYQQCLKAYTADQSIEGVLDARGKIATLDDRASAAAFKMGRLQDAVRLSDTAKRQFVSLIEGYKRISQDQGVSQISLLLGNLFLREKNYIQARKYYSQSLTAAKNIAGKFLMRDAYLGLAQLNQHEKKFEDAFDNLWHYKIYNDSLVNDESIRKSTAYKIKYETEKREDQIRLLSTESELQTVIAQKETLGKNVAVAGIGVVLAAGAYSFFRLRKKKRLQIEQNINQERFRISRELHDEVGATLSGVSMYSHLTKTQLSASDFAGVEHSLTVMQDSSIQMVNKLNDIVWLINPDQDSLAKLIVRLEDYARKMSAAKQVHLVISIPEQLPDYALSMDKRRNIYLIFKEAINNSVKYSDCSCLALKIDAASDALSITLIDDGRGFDINEIMKGNGLNNLQQRAMEIGAFLSLKSVPGMGTTVAMNLLVK